MTWTDTSPALHTSDDLESSGISALGISLETLDRAATTRSDADPSAPPPSQKADATIPTLPPGSRIGDYVLDSIIATGGFGSVYRAEHVHSGEKAAVKVLHPELALTREAVLRFEREVWAIRRIDHPNVIRVVDFGELRGGCPYFAMELLVGCDLETHIRRRGRLSPEEVLSILEPICNGLAAAHALSIIHRDLKASNVFLAETPSGPRVVLLDFGVAKLLDDAGPGITTTSHILGTPASMAPEQITGQAADARTDVYAVGALLYYLLTGELPFLDASLTAILHMHLYSKPPPPSREAPISQAFDEVVERAMAKEPASRYPDVLSVLHAFRAALDVARSEGIARSRPNGGRLMRSDLEARRVLALHIEVCADARALELACPDEPLLLDLERVLPLATSFLEPLGLEVVFETGNTMLLIKNIGGDPAGELAARRSGLGAAISLRRALDEREGRDPRVHVSLCAHAGEVLAAGGMIVCGDLLDVSTWIPTEAAAGVVATSEALAGLDLMTEPLNSRHSRVVR